MRPFFLILPLIALSTLSADEPFDTKKLTKIFNGKNLDGWHGNNPHTTSRAKEGPEKSLETQQAEFLEHWSVDEGALVNDGHGPYATTDREYGDIEFTVDYKTVPKADSGIYLRGTPQVQIWDHTNKDAFKHGADKGSGGLWNNNKDNPGKDPLVLADKAFGEWNQFHIRQLGARTWVWLNGQQVVNGAIMDNYWDRKAPLPASGPIHLQTHGGEICWKNIAVREIPGGEANQLLRGSDEGFTSIFNGKDLAGWAGPLENYEVVDGAIVCKAGKGGTLYHEDVLSDFVVRLEFKVPENGNNGLAIRYPGKGNPAYDAMCELQVLDNTGSKYTKLDARQYHGGAYGMAAAHVGYLRPVGNWNYQEVTVKGSTVKVELNGTVILDADLSKVDPATFMDGKKHPGLGLSEGHFGFAGHNDPVQFRNIAVKKL
ncbi:MAG: DUF1080 domain-containing protein [Verrucomicrobiales bacterium]|nr:DUF1080 domain-containing protein [Verrucomicrobiales bacterium]